MLKAHHSTVSADAALDLVRQYYPASNPQCCRILALGCHDNYFIQGIRRNFVLRLYRHSWWPEKDIDEELRFLQFLARRKVNVCTPVLSSSRQRYINAECAEGVRQAALFDYIPGRPLGHNYGKRQSNMTRLGELLAIIHDVSDDIKPAIQRWRMDFDSVFTPLLSNIAEIIVHRRKDIAFIHQLAQQVKEEILSHDNLDIGLCHGDLHLHNVMLQDDGTLTVFDFDWCTYSWRLYDLATIYWSMQFGKQATAPLAAVLRGYSRGRKLISRDKKLLPWFLIFRQFEFLHFQLSIRHRFGYAWLNDNYYDHHIGLLKKWQNENKKK